MILFTEFVGSFLFFFAWLLVRKYDLGPVSGLGALIKPFIIFTLDGACAVFGYGLGGFRNPDIAIGKVVWVAAYYRQIPTTDSQGKPSN